MLSEIKPSRLSSSLSLASWMNKKRFDSKNNWTTQGRIRRKIRKTQRINLPVATEICHHFATGKCTCGVACPYKHVTSNELRVATVNAANAPVGKTTPPSAQKPASVRQKCAKYMRTSPWVLTRCLRVLMSTYCAQCSSKGHTSYLCPTQMCTVPGWKKAHSGVSLLGL